MKFVRPRKKALGFTLIEIMVALGIMGAGVSIVLFYQGRAQATSSAKDATSAIANMVSKAKTYFAGAGSYNAITPAVLNSMGLVTQPLTWDGTNIRDPWGNVMGIAGNAAGTAPTFVATIGGATSAIDREVCTALATALANGADAVNIGASTAITTTNGIVGGGSAYKTTAGVLSIVNLNTGCTATNPTIGLQFH